MAQQCVVEDEANVVWFQRITAKLVDVFISIQHPVSFRKSVDHQAKLFAGD
ncbi:MAG: hypothetical protein K4305_03555 [Chlorobium sp.]|uniref:hypothetical protein n=1 Tax=Chlorobium sp. TaxID=1095 RepID=UPI002F42A8CA